MTNLKILCGLSLVYASVAANAFSSANPKLYGTDNHPRGLHFRTPTANSASAGIAWHDEFSFREGHSVLTIDTSRIVMGTPLTIHSRFDCAGSGGNYFNVFLRNWGGDMPAILAVFDSKRNYVGNLMEYDGFDRTINTIADWTYVPSNASITVTTTVAAGRLGSGALRPGFYHLQMIYNKSFIAPRPTDEKQMLAFQDKFDHSDLFRSNIVQIELVEK